MSKKFICICTLSGLLMNGLSAFDQNDVFQKASFTREFAEIDEAILREAQLIQDKESEDGATDEILWLYNNLGINILFRGDYWSALDSFDYILLRRSYDQENLLIGAALWGKAICHACLDMTEEMVQDFQMLEVYFKNLFHYDCPSKRDELIFTSSATASQVTSRTKVEFANPNENISAAECRDRVRGSAEKLRLFIGPLIKDRAKRAVFVRFIDALEEQGTYCCRDGSIWSTCVRPVLQKLHDWKVFGIPANPVWDD